MAYVIGKILGIMFATALCSYWNYRKWRERHAQDREGQLIGSTVAVMIMAFLGGFILGVPALLISLWVNKKMPVKNPIPDDQKDDQSKAS